MPSPRLLALPPAAPFPGGRRDSCRHCTRRPSPPRHLLTGRICHMRAVVRQEEAGMAAPPWRGRLRGPRMPAAEGDRGHGHRSRARPLTMTYVLMTSSRCPTCVMRSGLCPRSRSERVAPSEPPVLGLGARKEPAGARAPRPGSGWQRPQGWASRGLRAWLGRLAPSPVPGDTVTSGP